MRRQERRFVGWRAFLVMGIAAASQGGPAAAQFIGGSTGGGASAGGGVSGMYANPYAVPMLNPFLNPYAAVSTPANQQNLALYFMAAQASSGGIGSGQISGSRPRPGAQAPAPVSSARRVSDMPGSGAARYFNRAGQTGNTPKGHYNRYGNYYSANGH